MPVLAFWAWGGNQAQHDLQVPLESGSWLHSSPLFCSFCPGLHTYLHEPQLWAAWGWLVHWAVGSGSVSQLWELSLSGCENSSHKDWKSDLLSHRKSLSPCDHSCYLGFSCCFSARNPLSVLPILKSHALCQYVLRVTAGKGILEVPVALALVCVETGLSWAGISLVYTQLSNWLIMTQGPQGPQGRYSPSICRGQIPSVFKWSHHMLLGM